MPVIAAAIVTTNGKILLSRQFMDAARIRIEGLVAAFPKLVAGASKQSTYIDNGNVRYVYQPIEMLYLVLVTTRLSNIVEDLATLRLLGRLVSEQAGTTADEAAVSNKSFEICFAMDEVVTNGQREAVSLESVLTTLAMKSAEEERAKEEEAAAIDKAKKEARRKAYEIKQRKMDNAMGGIDGNSFGGGGAGGNNGGGSSGGSAAPTGMASRPDAVVIDTTVAKTSSTTVGGMSLSRAGRKTDQASRVLAESGAPPPSAAAAAAPTADASSAAASASHAGDSNAPVVLKIDEKISAQLNRDGGISSVDVRGDLFIHVNDPSAATLRIRLAPLAQDEFNFKTHPNINKALFQSDSVLVSKDIKPFPTGQSLGILRWRAQQLTRTKLPISVNCWPGDDSASIEFELENPSIVLTNVTIAIPLGGAFPSVDDLAVGSFRHDSGNSILYWDIPMIDRKVSSGTMDISLNRPVSGAFFPARVHFSAAQSLAQLQVVEVVQAETGRAINAAVETVVATDEYVVA